MVKYLGWVLGLLVLLISHMAPSLPTPPSSLAHRHTTFVRDARHGAMTPSYAVPRRSPTHPRAPFRDIANEVSHIQNAPSTRPVSPSLDPARSSFRDADRERQLALQESPSRRRRRIPGASGDENWSSSPAVGTRSSSPTPGASTSRVARTPPDTETTTAPVPSAQSLAQRARRQRKAGAQREREAAAGPMANAAPGPPAENINRYSAAQQERRERESRATKVLQLVPIQQEEPRGRRLPRKTIVQRPSNDVGSVNSWSAKMEWQHHLKIVGEMHRQNNPRLRRDTMDILQTVIRDHNQYANVFRHSYEILKDLG
ncbi:hypothetical protein B0H17DRAFT_1125528 [Mycena rosella]|uniref:Uncharacterized protein n=1 Tax=Mycena rosella TaxID=1033263 RepID=A0AAD7GWE9_MYCRO|nr:hypothetical protein B0H17DRAFT_1125528 [Mycena rosella]